MTQTFSWPFSFEGVGLNGTALAMTQPITAPITIIGWRVSYAMGFSKNSPTGFAECLFQGVLCTGVPTFNNSDKLMEPGGPVQLTTVGGPATLQNPNAVPAVGPGPTNFAGALFATIMKAAAPNGQSQIEVVMFPAGYGIPAVAGDYFMFLMAQENENQIPADCELQGHIFYTQG